MVQNTSDIIYSVNKYCQVEMFLKINVCHADINTYHISCKFVILINCLADCSSITKFMSLSMLFQEAIVELSLAILD